MSKNRNIGAFTVAIALCGSLTATTDAFAAQPAVNLGGTSFMDGFGDPTGYGLSYQNYLSWSHASKIKDGKGDDIPIFKNPKFDAIVDINQFCYTFKMPDSAFAQPGLNLMVPLVSLSADIKGSVPTGAPPPAPSEATVQLKDNGFGLGDITFGPFLQFRPVMVEHHPIFAHRIDIGVLIPTGKYDSTKDFNPGSHAWHFVPDWAATLTPAPRLEISNRFNYLFNFKNNDPGFADDGTTKLKSTQSGQAIFDNFAVAFEILQFNPTRSGAVNLRAGLNGYFLKQITENKTDGKSGSDTKEQIVGLGPGGMWVITNEDTLWLNVYFEMAAKMRLPSNTFQLRYARSFASF